VRLSPPRRDDAPFLIVLIRINHRNFQAVHQAHRIHSTFAIVKTIINLLNRWPIEDPHRILKGDPVPDDIAVVLLCIPTIVHNVYLHNVNIWPMLK